MMKQIRNMLAALSVLAVLAVSCVQPLEPPPAFNAGDSAGRVLLTVSAGGEGSIGTLGSIDSSARTILPLEPSFSRYELVVSRTGFDDVIPPDTSGIYEGVAMQLAAGEWTASVKAYQTFTFDSLATEYLAAQGSAPLNVIAASITSLTVYLEPVPVGADAPKGIFTYRIDFPYGVTGALTFGTGDPVTLTDDATVSVEAESGYHDLFITLTKGDLIAGSADKVHIYSGLESFVYMSFTDDDFTSAVPLGGTITLPDGRSIAEGTIWAYSDAEYTSQIGAVSAAASWSISVPAANIGTTVYFKVETLDTAGRFYTGTADTGGPISETGVRGIVFADLADTPPDNVSGLVEARGNGQATLTWTDPADVDLDHIEITRTPGGTTLIRVEKETQTYTASELTNDTEYTFTVKAVDIGGNKSSGEILSLTPRPFLSLEEIPQYLDKASGGSVVNPVPLLVLISMDTEWADLLNAIRKANKYVALDLSGCTMTGSSHAFNPETGSAGKSLIVSLILPDRAKSVQGGTYASDAPFRLFTGLKSVSGINILSVGGYAFSGCTALATVEFPAATGIGERAFFGCTALTTVNLPAAASISSYAFSGCTALGTVEFPVAVDIGGYAFSGCTGLAEVEFPAATGVGYYAFSSCTNLTTVNFPAAASIGQYAFSGCTALAEVEFPAATGIGYYAFSECTNLTTVEFPVAADIGEYAFSGTGLATVNLPAAISIGQYAFSGTNLGTVTLPKAATIGDRAFHNCVALTTVDLPAAASIGTYAFNGCGSLEELEFPAAATISSYAFSDCTALATVSLPAAAGIGQSAFSGCTKLVTASLPKAASISNNAFSGCIALITVELPAATSIGSYAFFGCTALATVTLPAATSIGSYAFSGCMALATVTLPAATSIGQSAFYNCTVLPMLTLPKATSIGQSAFSSCTALATVDFPAATSIGQSAFSSCTALATVTLPKAASIGQSAFYNCTKLSTVEFPAATDIGTSAFSSCTALEAVSFPKAASIGQSAFSGCTALAAVNLPVVTRINGYAFSSTGTAALTISLGNTVPFLGTEIFSQVYNSKNVTVKRPAAAAEGYGAAPSDTATTNWGNAFRGKGWSGGAAYQSGSVNEYIVLAIEDIEKE
jgi:hypothetical protein